MSRSIPGRKAAANEGIEVARAACLNSHMVAINNEAEGPLSDPRVRRAIHLAVDKSLIDTFAPVWEPAFVTRWLPSASPFATPQDELLTMPGYRPDKTEDIATAKALLADAGYPDGFETTFTAWTEAASSKSPGACLCRVVAHQSGNYRRYRSR
ncbi:MAG: ABC transporter substrate-binding protein [Caldilineaceae bacterium]